MIVRPYDGKCSINIVGRLLAAAGYFAKTKYRAVRRKYRNGTTTEYPPVEVGYSDGGSKQPPNSRKCYNNHVIARSEATWQSPAAIFRQPVILSGVKRSRRIFALILMQMSLRSAARPYGAYCKKHDPAGRAFDFIPCLRGRGASRSPHRT